MPGEGKGKREKIQQWGCHNPPMRKRIRSKPSCAWALRPYVFDLLFLVIGGWHPRSWILITGGRERKKENESHMCGHKGQEIDRTTFLFSFISLFHGQLSFPFHLKEKKNPVSSLRERANGWGPSNAWFALSELTEFSFFMKRKVWRSYDRLISLFFFY